MLTGHDLSFKKKKPNSEDNDFLPFINCHMFLTTF